MRILILGGNGMLGHRLLQSWQDRHQVRVTLRGPLSQYAEHNRFTTENAIDRVDLLDDARVAEVLDKVRPDAVVNAAGLIKQRDQAKEAVGCLRVNSVLPHRLNDLCRERSIRFVHVSTDCVFNGQRGGYTEVDPTDAEDVYGLSKFLGEVREAPGVTLRSSIIGLELTGKRSLIEWFLAQRGVINGFTRAIYSGVTTQEMARIIETVLLEHPDLTGLWHVASEPINKCELLQRFAQRLGRSDIKIVPDAKFHCDRSLDGSAFTRRTGYEVSAWDAMLQQLVDEVNRRGAHCDAA